MHIVLKRRGYGMLALIVGMIVLLWWQEQLSLLALGILSILSIGIFVFFGLRHRAGDKLQAAEEQAERQGIRFFRAQALNQLPSPILLIDSEHTITFANDEALTLFGRQLSGEDVYQTLPKAELKKQIDMALDGITHEREAVHYTTVTDRSFDITVAAVPDHRPDTVRQVMLFFYEVTSMLRTERMRVDFVANASHELRTPLSSLMGSIETLQGPAKKDPAGRKRFLKIMQKEAARMARLVDDLLSLSHIELERHKTPSTYIDLRTVILNAISSVEAMGAKRGIKFRTHMPRNMAPILADEDQITQVLLNLLVNAAKYADTNTRVMVRAVLNKSGTLVTVSINDQGPGIAPKHLARLTERFYRVDTARSRKMGGTGLGLAIVKHILLRHDTNLTIKSSLGTGTRFSFELKTKDYNEPIVAEDTTMEFSK